MSPILIKIFATALALGQVTTGPDAVKTGVRSGPGPGRGGAAARDGCAQMRKSFDIEDINLDELIETAMKDPQALTGEIKAFKGLNFSDLHRRLPAVLQERDGRRARRSTSAR